MWIYFLIALFLGFFGKLHINGKEVRGFKRFIIWFIFGPPFLIIFILFIGLVLSIIIPIFIIIGCIMIILKIINFFV